jgi:DNA-binding Lrp family transcriptional regulator
MSIEGSQVKLMSTTHFRPRRIGPEAVIEDTVACRILSLFENNDQILWIARSLPIGASMPDILTVSCHPDVFALSQIEKPNLQILAYLRVVSWAGLETIAKYLQISSKVTMNRLDVLVDAGVVCRYSDIYSLSPTWQEILPEVIAIEVKVSKWQAAIQQAARNNIFTHQSFVALPCRIAQRIREFPVFSKLGIGLLSIEDNNSINIIRDCPRHQPLVWAYYYKIAALVAQHFVIAESKNAVRYADRES